MADYFAIKVRDVIIQKDLAALAKGTDLKASVPSHGVQLFVLTEQREKDDLPKYRRSRRGVDTPIHA